MREHLTTALRFLIVQRRIQEIRAILPEIDAATIVSEISGIRTALKKITLIKSQATSVEQSAEAIRTQAASLSDEIGAALTKIEHSIQLAKNKELPPKKMAARA